MIEVCYELARKFHQPAEPGTMLTDGVMPHLLQARTKRLFPTS